MSTDRRTLLKGMLGAALGIAGVRTTETSEGTILHSHVSYHKRSPGQMWGGARVDFEVHRKVPTSIDDPLWSELVDSPEDVHRLAMSAFILHAQMAARVEIRARGEELTEEDVQRAFESYKFGTKKHRRL